MNKTQRAAMTVKCPACGAGKGQECRGTTAPRFAGDVNVSSHVERYMKAMRSGSTRFER